MLALDFHHFFLSHSIRRGQKEILNAIAKRLLGNMASGRQCFTPGCQVMCEGVLCVAGCEGDGCQAKCLGALCKAWCKGENCIQSTTMF
ncbi:uncharacterized protein isoform X2 [Choristoneura fumiferana]|uniref:uncharacterized protein isoform X2 n=1 Tax=Choristoneura fumiferana TaxID=7141 RepID=UPI003D158CD9